MKLAVFRAEADGRRTARRLAALGHEGVLAPVIAIVPTGVAVDGSSADAIVMTSQHAVPTLRKSDKNRLHTLPCFCVGTRTADAAAAAGFSDVHSAAGDGLALAAAIQRALPRGARVTFLAGRDRKPDLEAALTRDDFAVRVVEAYAAEPAAAWSATIASALATCVGALHYSQRSARLAFARAEAAGLAPQFRSWVHLCLSEDIAAWLRPRGLACIRVAPAPEETALLSLL